MFFLFKKIFFIEHLPPTASMFYSSHECLCRHFNHVIKKAFLNIFDQHIGIKRVCHTIYFIKTVCFTRSLQLLAFHSTNFSVAGIKKLLKSSEFPKTHHKNTCGGIFLIKLQFDCSFLKIDSLAGVFLSVL